ncbi:MAG: hypothetical protein CR993_09740 [Rhodobacterales bacterium]|nr:MAG: hypothetical protein CR993_09740 [Rhodobacterales bacterium]
MTREFAMQCAGSKPGAEQSDPWGDPPGSHQVFKVSGKIFAAMSDDSEGVSVKCPDVETAAMLI